MTRDEVIVYLRNEESYSCADIGEIVGLSRQRVHQIIKKYYEEDCNVSKVNHFYKWNYKRCKYSKIARWLNDNEISLTKLITMNGFNETNSNIKKKIGAQLNGKNNFEKPLIDFFIKEMNTTYEELFKE